MSSFSEVKDPFSFSDEQMALAIESTDIVSAMRHFFDNKPRPVHNWQEELSHGIEPNARECQVWLADNKFYVMNHFDDNVQDDTCGHGIGNMLRGNHDVSRLPSPYMTARATILGRVTVGSDVAPSVYWMHGLTDTEGVVITKYQSYGTPGKLIDTPLAILPNVAGTAQLLHPEIDSIDAEALSLQIVDVTFNEGPVAVVQHDELKVLRAALLVASTLPCNCKSFD